MYHPRVEFTVKVNDSALAHPVDGIVGERTRRENHVARRANGIRLVTATPEIAESVRGIVVEAAAGVQQVFGLTANIRCRWLLATVRPVTQSVGRTLVHRRHRAMVLRLLTPW